MSVYPRSHRPANARLLGTALVGIALSVLGVAALASGSPSSASTCTPTQIVEHWSTQRLVEQLIVVPVDQSAISAAGPEVAAGAGGVLLTGSAPADLSAQLHRLMLKAPSGVAPFVMTDEEGGAVQRLVPLIPSFPSPRALGATMSPSAIQSFALGIGRQMRSIGLTMDLAPVADVDAGPGPSSSDVDGTRSFSGNASVAANDAIAFARGLDLAGVTPVVKHFPGLGGSSGDTDVESASTLSWATLLHGGLVPFIDAIAAKVPVIMVSNASIPGLSKMPASLSRVVIIGELRHVLKFHGLIITDSLSAVAISNAGYSVPKAVVASLVAGSDMVLFNADASSLARMTNSIVRYVRVAVQDKHLTRAQLISAAAQVLSAKHIASCQLSA